MTKVEQTTPPQLPGDCVPIPQVTGAVRDAQGEVYRLLETHVVADLDLDGFKSPVILVPPDRQDLNENAVWWRLFIQRGDCGHELGLVTGLEDPVLAQGTSHGLCNFSVMDTVRMDISDGQGIGMKTYSFDGIRYVGGRTDYR